MGRLARAAVTAGAIEHHRDKKETKKEAKEQAEQKEEKK
jgi:hypothetical protein